MDLLPVLGIALGLAMDAFSVAIATGIALDKVTHRQTFRLSFHFGLFQFMMPIFGWLVGTQVEGYVSAYDHWIAFALLAYVGGKMIRDSLSSEDVRLKGDPTRGMSLVLLSVATSIDALAVGLSLAVVRVPVLGPSIIIGVVAAAMTILGLRLGKQAGALLGRRMETIGGLVLLGIGVKIVLEHVFA
ncbi:MAG: manganese efflux pump MntP family protein [Dehalococcoidia bacterium]|nr:manganese efflux pump MntP family protein [Dehalococcoidia bacterium]